MVKFSMLPGVLPSCPDALSVEQLHRNTFHCGKKGCARPAAELQVLFGRLFHNDYWQQISQPAMLKFDELVCLCLFENMVPHGTVLESLLHVPL